jgi:hypothetical protein
MHELAVIVGEEVTVRDLVPVFDQFLGDLDEVRIGVLKHLADFIKVYIHAFNAESWPLSLGCSSSLAVTDGCLFNFNVF